jgi:hypothetical protein
MMEVTIMKQELSKNMTDDATRRRVLGLLGSIGEKEPMSIEASAWFLRRHGIKVWTS